MLADVLPQEAFAFILIFARIGAMIMLLPGIGENSVPARIRLSFALAVSFLMYFVNFGIVPPIPDVMLEMVAVIMKEVIVGLMIGLASRLILTSMHVAGTIISFHVGLSAAQNFDPNQGAQGAIVSAFLTIFAILIIFATDMHHLLIQAMGESYYMFPIGASLQFNEFGLQVTQVVSDAFMLGVQMASPFILYTIVFNSALGLVSRVLPQFQIFFIAMPANILVGFILLSMLIPAIMIWFMQYFENQVMIFIPQ